MKVKVKVSPLHHFPSTNHVRRLRYYRKLQQLNEKKNFPLELYK